jgi:hypothetical protein
MKTIFAWLRGVWKADAFSPTAFCVRACLVTLLFCVSELLGLREYTTFLSGTSANLNVSWQTAATLGLIHLFLYVAFILLVPVFLIAAGLLFVWNQLNDRKWQRLPDGRCAERRGRSELEILDSKGNVG